VRTSNLARYGNCYNGDKYEFCCFLCCAGVKLGRKLQQFDVHGSVYPGNVYVQLKFQLDVHVFICIIYYSLFLVLHVSGAISTHP
jgi:hypothetical protein